MAVGDIIRFTTIEDYYASLNSARLKFNLSAITPPASEQGKIAKATVMNNLDSALDQVVTDTASVSSRQHYSKSQDFSVSQGSLIRDISSDMLALFTEWDNTCFDRAHNASNWGDYGDCGSDNHAQCSGAYCWSQHDSNCILNNYSDFGTQNTACSGAQMDVVDTTYSHDCLNE